MNKNPESFLNRTISKIFNKDRKLTDQEKELEAILNSYRVKHRNTTEYSKEDDDYDPKNKVFWADPNLTVEYNEKAYQQNKASWDELYDYQFIAVYKGEVIASNLDKENLVDMIDEMQNKNRPFRAYFIQIGKSLSVINGNFKIIGKE